MEQQLQHVVKKFVLGSTKIYPWAFIIQYVLMRFCLYLILTFQAIRMTTQHITQVKISGVIDSLENIVGLKIKA